MLVHNQATVDDKWTVKESEEYAFLKNGGSKNVATGRSQFTNHTVSRVDMTDCGDSLHSCYAALKVLDNVATGRW